MFFRSLFFVSCFIFSFVVHAEDLGKEQVKDSSDSVPAYGQGEQSADESPKPPKKAFQFVLYGSMTAGGDKIVENGEKEQRDLYAGDLLHFGFGFNRHISENLLLEALLGMKMSAIKDDDQEASFVRVPISLMLIKNYGDLNLGFGAIYHTSPELEVIVGSTINRTKYDNTLGPLVSISSRVNERIALGLEYSHLTYTKKNHKDLDGSSVGIFLKFFP